MLEMVGELADGVLMNWTAVDYLGEAIGHIKRGRRKPAGTQMRSTSQVTCVWPWGMTSRRPGTR